MRTILALLLLTISFGFWGQQSEDIIPKDAVSVFSLNNISILQKVSMDELVSYEFMTELQSELFDGSTQGKTLKDSGIDFNQKMNIFYGKNTDFELSGFTFGISDKNKLFEVFDDFDRVESIVPGIEYYNNYFNHLMISGQVGILIRVDTDQDKLTEITDSIWVARGFELPWMQEFENYYEDGEEQLYFDEEGNEIEEIVIEGSESEPEMDLGEEVFSDSSLINEEYGSDQFKNYYELRDSLESELSRQRLQVLIQELFVEGKNLKDSDTRFAQQMTHQSDAVFYLDNSRNLKNSNGLWYFQTMFPEMYKDLNELYTGNVMLGDVSLNKESIDIQVEANYGEALGSIYQELNSAKFDKNVLKFIPQSNSGFFTYNIDLKKGYDKAYSILMPILSEEKNPRISANVLIMELMNDFINTDEVFNTYKGSMFASFNGVKRVKTKRIDFFYDEETFEYGEREIESEEDMPIFTVGFSTARPDVPEKILKHMSRVTSQFKNKGDYWVYEEAILNSVPLYMINAKGLFIFTNDEDLAKNHPKGYGKDAVTGISAKNAAKSGSMYSYVNLGSVIDQMPKEILSTQRNEFLESMRGKKGVFELTSSKTSRQKTVYKMTYAFDGSFENGGKYLLDLMNSAYILSKQ